MSTHKPTKTQQLLLLALTTAWAGAWTQKQGGYYLKLAANSLEAHSDFDADGKRVTKPAMGELQDFNIAAYLEYGLRDRLTLVAATPYKRLSDKRTLPPVSAASATATWPTSRCACAGASSPP